MIRVRTFRNGRNELIGFRSTGHADFDESGKDIICAAVSVLELNLANSVSELTDARFSCEVNEENGDFSFRLAGTEDEKAVLLLASCMLGLQTVSEEYGSNFLKIQDQEV